MRVLKVADSVLVPVPVALNGNGTGIVGGTAAESGRGTVIITGTTSERDCYLNILHERWGGIPPDMVGAAEVEAGAEEETVIITGR